MISNLRIRSNVLLIYNHNSVLAKPLVYLKITVFYNECLWKILKNGKYNLLMVLRVLCNNQFPYFFLVFVIYLTIFKGMLQEYWEIDMFLETFRLLACAISNFV